MKLLGIEIKPIDKNDFFIVGIVVLIGLLLIIPLSSVVAPPTIIAWTFAVACGAFLSAAGVRAQDGMKPTLVVIVATIPSALAGHLVGLQIMALMGA